MVENDVMEREYLGCRTARPVAVSRIMPAAQQKHACGGMPYWSCVVGRIAVSLIVVFLIVLGLYLALK